MESKPEVQEREPSRAPQSLNYDDPITFQCLLRVYSESATLSLQELPTQDRELLKKLPKAPSIQILSFSVSQWSFASHRPDPRSVLDSLRAASFWNVQTVRPCFAAEAPVAGSLSAPPQDVFPLWWQNWTRGTMCLALQVMNERKATLRSCSCGRGPCCHLLHFWSQPHRAQCDGLANATFDNLSCEKDCCVA